MQNTNADKLAEYVRTVLAEKKLSTYQVAKNAGGGIDQSTVSRIKNGDIKNPSLPILKALAKGLGVTEEEIIALARGVQPRTSAVNNERFQSMALKFDQLPPEGQEKTRELIDYLDSILDKRLEESQKDKGG